MTLERWQAKEIWDENDYITSLELLRNEDELADRVYLQLDAELFYNILDFEAGWLENFWALPEEERLKYKEAFLNI